MQPDPIQPDEWDNAWDEDEEEGGEVIDESRMQRVLKLRYDEEENMESATSSDSDDGLAWRTTPLGSVKSPDDLKSPQIVEPSLVQSRIEKNVNEQVEVKGVKGMRVEEKEKEKEKKLLAEEFKSNRLRETRSDETITERVSILRYDETNCLA